MNRSNFNKDCCVSPFSLATNCGQNCLKSKQMFFTKIVTRSTNAWQTVVSSCPIKSNSQSLTKNGAQGRGPIGWTNGRKNRYNGDSNTLPSREAPWKIDAFQNETQLAMEGDWKHRYRPRQWTDLKEFGCDLEPLVALDALLRSYAALHRGDVEQHAHLLVAAERQRCKSWEKSIGSNKFLGKRVSSITRSRKYFFQQFGVSKACCFVLFVVVFFFFSHNRSGKEQAESMRYFAKNEPLSIQTNSK